MYTAENEQDEASHIADVIGQHLKAGGHLADHAILYRMNAQSAPIESYFTRAGIPHKIVGGQRFNDRKEVKDIHSYMSIVANPRDDVRLRRIINEPARKIGATTVDVIADLAGQQGVSMLDVISHADQYAKLSRAVMPLLKFWQIYQRLQDSLATRTLDEFASDVIELTGYKAMLEADAAKGHEDAADRLQNLGQLVNNVKNYCDQHGEEATLEGYLEDIALISDIDSYNESSDQVVLMTIHSAKGLEFPYVFLIGMEEGVFPSEMSKYSEADLEEERRLCLRWHHPRQKGAVHLQQRHPDAVWPHPAQRARAAFCGRSSRNISRRPAARCWNSVPAWAVGAVVTAIPCPAGHPATPAPPVTAAAATAAVMARVTVRATAAAT